MFHHFVIWPVAKTLSLRNRLAGSLTVADDYAGKQVQVLG